MTRFLMLSLGSAAALFTALFANAAPPPAVADPANPAVRPAEIQSYRAKSVLGSTVHISGNTSIGTVDDIVFTDDGRIDYLIVNNDNKLVTVPWEAAKFDLEKRTATLTISPDQYKQIPTYTTREYPNYYTPNYRDQVYKFYGLTPGQIRRIERR